MIDVESALVELQDAQDALFDKEFLVWLCSVRARIPAGTSLQEFTGWTQDEWRREFFSIRKSAHP
jgi:hypothetical protein